MNWYQTSHLIVSNDTTGQKIWWKYFFQYWLNRQHKSIIPGRRETHEVGLMISYTLCLDIISQLWHRKQASKQSMMFRAFEATGICKVGHHLRRSYEGERSRNLWMLYSIGTVSNYLRITREQLLRGQKWKRNYRGQVVLAAVSWICFSHSRKTLLTPC